MKHRFVLIGHGNITRRYMHAIRAIGQATIAGVVGRDEQRAQAFAAEHGIPCAGTNLGDIARQSGATAAIVCTPNGVHHEGVLEASALGLHCLCEKPLHIVPSVQETMIENCRKHGVKLGVSYMWRHQPHLGYLKRLIDDGKLGRVLVADVLLRSYRPPEYYRSWHGSRALDGGGPLMQQGSHLVDLALWLCNGYTDILSAGRFRMVHAIETEDHCYATLRYGNGAVGSISASTACRGLDKQSVAITGTNGSVEANIDGFVSFDVQGVARPDIPRLSDKFEPLLRDFIDAMETGREPLVDGESGKAATACIVDIYDKAGEPAEWADANRPSPFAEQSPLAGQSPPSRTENQMK